MSASKEEIDQFFKETTEGWSENWANTVEREELAEKTRDLFVFEPSEFRVLEDIEYDETIQRPEEIRFFTLDEQVGDAYEKMVPRGRTTKFELEVLRKEAERMRELYEAYIVPTADTYELREPEYGKVFTWINPVYASADIKKYSYAQSWLPLYEEARITAPNFYRSMMTALPHPFETEREGVPFALTRAEELVDSDGLYPLRALPTFMYPRTRRHEDGRFDILEVPMENTVDNVNFVGYYAKKRPLPVPNPLPDHPFLKSSDAVMIESTAPLSEIVPSLDAIMTHAVPVTADPYGEGMKYLKMYDIQLSDIPWNSWKSRFPPAEASGSQQEPLAVDFPKPTGDEPSKKLLEYYAPYYPAQSSRYWLMDQLDGGELLVHMLLSQVGQNGTVGMRPGSDAEFEYPKTTLAECDLMGLDFHDFSIRGTLRRTWGAKDKITYQCVPLELVKQERKREGYKGRIQWKEGSPKDILEAYVTAFVDHRPMEFKFKKEEKPAPRPAKDVPQLRKNIMAVLADDKRFAEDKLKDVGDLLRGAILSENTYTDSSGLFLLCRHTMAILSGELANDRLKFYDTWTARVDGFRVCKSCGEHVNSDVLEEQEEFNDEGRVMRHAEVLPTKTFKGRGVADHVKSLSALKDLFDMARPSDEVFFMLISLLHVFPDVDQFLPILDAGRAIGNQLKDLAGIAGITQMILLLQSHVPALVPRRSFGTKPLTLRGYPRDSPNPEGYTIVDSMILVLSKTLEAYPTSFKGSSATTMRLVLNNPKKVKTTVQAVLGVLLKQSVPLKEAMERGRAAAPVEVPVAPHTMIPGTLVVPSKDKFGTITGPPACPTNRAYWTSVRLPKIRQPEVPLRMGINHFVLPESTMKKLVEQPVSERTTPVTVNVKDKEVASRLKMGKTVASEDWHTNSLILSRLTDVFAIPNRARAIDSLQKSDDLRDITKGYVYETIKEIEKEPLTKTKLISLLKTDASMVLLTADLVEAKRITNTLKAKERTTFTDRMRNKTDTDREITKELIDRGLAPAITTRDDRRLFAREERAMEEEERRQEEDDEIGVGRPVEYEDQGELPVPGDVEERGNYGDYANAPGNDGRDYEQPDQFDDDDRGV